MIEDDLISIKSFEKGYDLEKIVPFLNKIFPNDNYKEEEEIKSLKNDYNINDKKSENNLVEPIHKPVFILRKKNRGNQREEINQKKIINKEHINLISNFSESHNIKVKCLKNKKRKIKNSKIHTSHTALSEDNILRKIQVHFLSFIVNYTNDVIFALFNDSEIRRFNHLNYSFKKKVKHKYIEDLKKKTIGDILKTDITPKYKKITKNINSLIYDEIINKYPSFKNFFEINYLNLFRQYYNNDDNIFKYDGQIIPLSDETKTKTFSYLISKYHSYKEKIKYVSINYYINKRENL